jgi:glyoxylase-like metal-dependent hydrolase (beta-lactamase superfamily II)
LINIFQLELTFGDAQSQNIYPTLIQIDSKLILVDAGYPNQIVQFKSQFKSIGLDFCDLTAVFITHHDFDHIGSLAEIKRLIPKVQVFSSAAEKEYIEKKIEPLRITQAKRLMNNQDPELLQKSISFIDYINSIESVSVDCIFNSESPIFDAIIPIPTPGHTLGHYSFYIPKLKAFISGDSLLSVNGNLAIANPEFAEDINLCKNSIKVISDLDIDNIYCYHGGFVSSDIKNKLSILAI